MANTYWMENVSTESKNMTRQASTGGEGEVRNYPNIDPLPEAQHRRETKLMLSHGRA